MISEYTNENQEVDKSAANSACGISFLSDFWEEKYLREYIRDGGSKIKFVTGREGSGKTYFLQLLTRLAKNENYKTVHFSARDIWMHDFREIYIEIFNQCHIMDCLEAVSHHLIEEMGFDAGEIPEGMKFIDYLSQNGMGDALTKREIRTQLKQIFLDNPMLDNNFALACSMLTGSVLGYPILEEQNRDLLLAWLEGDRTVKLAQLRAMGFYPSRITKYNARHMLRSLAEVIHMGGYSGLFIAIDDLEILISRSSLEPIHYTKMKREDTYESIRQLIDDIDSMKYIMFVYGFDRKLIDDENAGLKSYQALWMRIQNEIQGERFNRFADMADLDRLAVQEYTPEVIVAISRNLVQMQQSCVTAPLAMEEAEDILLQARTGAVGIPQLIQTAIAREREEAQEWAGDMEPGLSQDMEAAEASDLSQETEEAEASGPSQEIETAEVSGLPQEREAAEVSGLSQEIETVEVSELSRTSEGGTDRYLSLIPPENEDEDAVSQRTQEAEKHV